MPSTTAKLAPPSLALLACLVAACGSRPEHTASLECHIRATDSRLAATLQRAQGDSIVWFVYDPSCPACNDMFPVIYDLSNAWHVEYIPTAIIDQRSIDAALAVDFAKQSGRLHETLEYQHEFFRDHRRAPLLDEMLADVPPADEHAAFERFVSAPSRRLELVRMQRAIVTAGISAVPAVVFRQWVLAGNNTQCLEVLLRYANP